MRIRYRQRRTSTVGVARHGGALLVAAVSLLSLGASQQPASPLPNSALPVTLLGIAMDAATPARSSCLVRCTYPGEKQTISVFLAIGQRACGLAEIAEIHQETVVVKNLQTDRLELLTFPKGINVSRDASSGTAGAARPAPPAADRSPSSNIVTVEVHKETIDRSLANLPELLTSAVATPHFRDAGNGQSTIEGFEINGIKKASAAEQLGLANGDVILEVNGDQLDGAASIFRLFGQVNVAAQSKLTVLRNGQRITVVVNVR